MMKMSALFGRTRRKNDTDDGSAATLLVRAGFVRQLAAGVYTLLPAALSTARKIEEIIRTEMNAIDGQEILMPVVHPADIWKESGRWAEIGSELGRFSDRNDREMVLAMTHEEVVSDLVRNEVHSYRQLPVMIYHIQTKWRDDPRPRAGLIRVREFTMADSYSLDIDEAGMKTQYHAHLESYKRIFTACDIPFRVVESDTGAMGGSVAHEYMYPTDIGEDTIIECAACGYAANQQIAEFDRVKSLTGGSSEPSGRPYGEPENGTLEKIHTPGCRTIAELSAFLGVAEYTCAKAVFMAAEFETGKARTVIVMLPGDREVNEAKLTRILASDRAIVRTLRPATEEQITSVGAVPGYGSPIETNGAYVVADASLETITNMVTGANETDYHYRNMNFPRDFAADVVADVSNARDGDSCPHCGATMSSFHAVEVGNIFQLGTRYSEPFGCTYLDDSGTRKPVYMGSYGIGVGRLMACIAEEHRDDSGLVWPVSVAPFDVHIVDLASEPEHGINLSTLLESSGLTVLIDDRSERAGVKFNDADLIGIPVRITVGDRSLAKGVFELSVRKTGERKEIPIGNIDSEILMIRENL